MDFAEYERMIDALQRAEYKFAGFDHDVHSLGARGHALIRHDIDFSLSLAAEMAEWEYSNGVRATYFVQARSPLYNALSSESRDLMQSFSSWGHAIGLHFDASSYPAADAEVVKVELDTLALNVPSLLRSPVSLHRPISGLEQIRRWSASLGITSAYDAPWTSEFSYFSDSGGAWRQGSPVESNAFRTRQGLQILIHPLWWLIPGQAPSTQLMEFGVYSQHETLRHIRRTVVSFDF